MKLCHLHSATSRTWASWRLFLYSGCRPSTPLRRALRISTTFPSWIAYLALLKIYCAQALPRRGVGALRLCNVSTSTQDYNSIPQLASAISLASSSLRLLVPSAPNRPFLCAIFKAVLTIRRQVNMCEFTVVLPVSQSLENQQTPTSDDGGTSLESGNLRASLRGLRETLNFWEAETGGY